MRFLSSWASRLAPQIALFAILLLAISHAPRPLQKLFPEGSSTCQTSVVFNCANCIPFPSSDAPSSQLGAVGTDDWTYNPRRDANNYHLTSAQCSTAFPGLFTDLEHSRRQRSQNHIQPAELDANPYPKATIRALVVNQSLHILKAVRPTVRGSRHMATLHSLHRAIIASSEPLPNIEFVLTVDDFVPAEAQGHVLWAYTRRAGENATWLMPDFGYWGWAEDAIGEYSDVRLRVAGVEKHVGGFKSKIPKVFWRGNTRIAPRMRGDLVKVTKGKEWADVKGIDWGDKEDLKENLFAVEDHCRYMFLIHTEGISFSGRLKYLQNCHSLLFAHTMQWILPSSYLMVAEGPLQNYVPVSRDFSDLEAKVEYYLAHPDEAERIASNAVATFRDVYVTPAAEACHWRALIRAWAEVSFTPEAIEQGSYSDESRNNATVGSLPFEIYAMKQRRDFINGVV